jgi:hypothetical protein
MPPPTTLDESTSQTPTGAPIELKRRGPKPKSLAERTLNLEPIRRLERTYSKAQKVRVLVYLYHHRVKRKPSERTVERPVPPELISTLQEGYRLATFTEASVLYGVPLATIKNWWNNREKIVSLTETKDRESSPE